MPMPGYHTKNRDSLAGCDLLALADILAIQLHERLGARVYMLQRSDVRELIAPFVDDLIAEDRRAVSWMVWHLFQDALELEMEA